MNGGGHPRPSMVEQLIELGGEEVQDLLLVTILRCEAAQIVHDGSLILRFQRTEVVIQALGSLGVPLAIERVVRLDKWCLTS